MALGIGWALVIFAVTLLHVTTGWFGPVIGLLRGHYLGLGPTFLGAPAGLVFGFVEGMWFGIVFSLLWNAIRAGHLKQSLPDRSIIP